MQRVSPLIGVGLLIVCGVSTAAPTPVSRSALARHQLAACMTREMAASRTMFYNEASRVCKARLQSTGSMLASSTGVKAGSGMGR